VRSVDLAQSRGSHEGQPTVQLAPGSSGTPEVRAQVASEEGRSTSADPDPIHPPIWERPALDENDGPRDVGERVPDRRIDPVDDHPTVLRTENVLRMEVSVAKAVPRGESIESGEEPMPQVLRKGSRPTHLLAQSLSQLGERNARPNRRPMKSCMESSKVRAEASKPPRLSGRRLEHRPSVDPLECDGQRARALHETSDLRHRKTKVCDRLRVIQFGENVLRPDPRSEALDHSTFAPGEDLRGSPFGEGRAEVSPRLGSDFVVPRSIRSRRPPPFAH